MQLAVFKDTGDVYKYFGDIVIVVSEKRDCGRVVYGCVASDEDRFYKAILEMDLDNPVIGFKTVEEVKAYWLEGGDGQFMVFSEEDLIIIPNAKNELESEEK